MVGEWGGGVLLTKLTDLSVAVVQELNQLVCPSIRGKNSLVEGLEVVPLRALWAFLR